MLEIGSAERDFVKLMGEKELAIGCPTLANLPIE